MIIEMFFCDSRDLLTISLNLKELRFHFCTPPIPNSFVDVPKSTTNILVTGVKNIYCKAEYICADVFL